MLGELVSEGKRLEIKGQLPPAGYYYYAQDKPIRWIVHLFPDRIRITGPTELHTWRPSSGRTSGEESHLLVDEAGYCLGVTLEKRDSKTGKETFSTKSARRHELFRQLYRKFLESPHLTDPSLREAILWFDNAIENGTLQTELDRHPSIMLKEWVSLVPEHGPLTDMPLFEHPDAQAFWIEEMKERTQQMAGMPPIPVRGHCSICGRPDVVLLRKLPLQVKLVGQTPLHSLNENSFVSFVGGGDAKSKTHIGLCFECGDTAARAFNFLRNSQQNRVQVVRHPVANKRDSPINQYAVFWLKVPVPEKVSSVEFDLEDLADLKFGAPILASTPGAELSQLLELLKLPWSPTESLLRLDQAGFYLALVSPNVGRIAVRDWFTVNLRSLQRNLRFFLEYSKMVGSWGDQITPVSIGSMVEAISLQSAEVTRLLLRTAYTGSKPPEWIGFYAGQRLNHLLSIEHSLRERQQKRSPSSQPVWKDAWPKALASAFRLCACYGKGELMGTLENLNPLHTSVAYQCGRMVAVLDQAQRVYAKEQTGKWPESTSIQRSYGGAAENPQTIIGQMLKLSTSAHLPKAGQRLNRLVEEIQATIAELGGMKEPLTAQEQGDFGTGFYQQRAALRAERSVDGEDAQLVQERSN